MINNVYELYILSNNKWHLIEKVNTIHEVNISVNYIYENYPNKTIQILYNDNLLCTLDGSDYQKFWFYNKYVLRINNFDYISEYEKEKRLK